MTAETQQIKIMAEVLQHDRSSCKFTVDRPIFRGFMKFGNKEKAQGSPLVERLFAIEGVAGVILQGADVTVTKQGNVDWRAAGPAIGAAIRAHLGTGQPAVSEEALKAKAPEDQLRERVQQILDEQVNPMIASHGGTVTLLDVEGTRLLIQMGGRCQGCSGANATLRDGVEEMLRNQIPEITEILDITDHDAGENPYFRH